jgi:hypothetical protein
VSPIIFLLVLLALAIIVVVEVNIDEFAAFELACASDTKLDAAEEFEELELPMASN